jgi:hypothetical protein
VGLAFASYLVTLHDQKTLQFAVLLDVRTTTILCLKISAVHELRNIPLTGRTMSTKAILILVGIVVALLGFAQLASSPRGTPNRGFQISNIGVNVGITRLPRSQFGVRATGKGNSGTGVQPIGADWIGLTTATFGFLTIMVGMIKA